MRKNTRTMLTGMIVAALGLVFVPKLYVSLAAKFGKLAEIKPIGEA